MISISANAATKEFLIACNNDINGFRKAAGNFLKKSAKNCTHGAFRKQFI
jgi:hypothetical protein